MSSLGAAVVNNLFAIGREKYAREENYKYGEQAANAADERTRALYRDLYSPQAQMQQLKEAGLSPSIYASGGLAGQSGHSGAQGTGASGISPDVYGIDPLADSQIKLNNAQAANVNENTVEKELENEIKKLTNETFKNEWDLMNLTFGGNYNPETGKNDFESWEDIADSCESYEQFKNKMQNEDKFKYNDKLKMFINSQRGEQFLQTIWKQNKEFDKDITNIINEQAKSELELGITKLLNNNDFISKSAQAKKEEIENIVNNLKLDNKERESLNNLVEKVCGEGDNIGLALLVILRNLLNSNAAKNAAGTIAGVAKFL